MAATPGLVSLVGAGPGAAGLMTVRGRDLLTAADAVVYERRSQRALVPERAERYYVGRRRDGTRADPSAVRQLVVALARQGRRVVYLLRGDPFSFGGGSELAQALHDAEIAFEVVPGVASANVASAYTGVPLVSPSLASTIIFASGRSGRRASAVAPDWTAIARVGGTVVVRDADDVLPVIVKAFARAGVPDEMPALVVSGVGGARQRTVTATLGTIESAIVQEGIGRRMTLVIGWTVLLRDELEWVERQSLHGRRIVVARSAYGGETTAAELRELGADVIETPLPRVARRDMDVLRREVERVGELEWIVFAAPDAVELFWEQLLAAGRDTRALARARIAAIGAPTAAALLDRGVTVDVVQDRFTAAALVELLSERSDVPGAELLLVADEESAEETARDLEGTGATVSWAAPYRMVPAERREERLRRRLEQRTPDLVVAASAAGAAIYARVAGPEMIAQVPVLAANDEAAAVLHAAGALTVDRPDSTDTARADAVIAAVVARLGRAGA